MDNISQCNATNGSCQTEFRIFVLASIFVAIIISLLSSCFWTKQSLFILTVVSLQWSDTVLHLRSACFHTSERDRRCDMIPSLLPVSVWVAHILGLFHSHLQRRDWNGHGEQNQDVSEEADVSIWNPSVWILSNSLSGKKTHTHFYTHSCGRIAYTRTLGEL